MADEWDDDISTPAPVVSAVKSTHGDTNRNFGDRPPRKDFNNDGDDRPRRRFNRDDNQENGDGGDRPRRRFNRDENQENGDGDDRPRRRFNRDDNQENGDGEDRPRRRFNRDDDNKEGGTNGEEKPHVPPYIPAEPTQDESEIFGSCIRSGTNFDNYDAIPVNASDNVSQPLTSFDSSGLRDYLINNIKKSGYTRPTPIQKYAIPTILAKKDLMACAQTGSGKTAAFILPILQTLFDESPTLENLKPQVVIVSPTRELTIQIFNEARKFALHSYLKIGIAYGGTASRYQSENITKGVHLLVATPGRLMDFVDKGFISFECVRFVVLDEADRMLDMGFMPTIEKLMNHPTMREKKERQTLMFSATFPEDIQILAGKFLEDYAFIAVGMVGSACRDVEQRIYEVARFKKREKLMEILEAEGPNGVMVFVETQRMADFLAAFLSETRFATTSIHGGRLQKEREMALADFRTGKMKVLVATSVAARGLDIQNVAHVVNFDLPKSIDDYVHRIGRTGRVGNQGKATSFYDAEQDSAIAPHLIRILEQAGQEVPPFLGAGGGGAAYQASNFGARDIRGGGNQEVIRPQPHEEEEEW